MNGNGHRRRRGTQRDYYWICAVEKSSGRPVVDGPYDSETEANQFGFSKNINDGDFEVHAFNTIDRMAARDKYKHIVFERSGNLGFILKRAKYKV